MSVVSMFFYVPAPVILVGIFFNTCSLCRRASKTKYAEKAGAIAAPGYMRI